MSALPSAVSQALQANLHDPKWRLNNLYWILTKEGEEIQFRLNWAQQEIINRWWYNILVLKARQLGMTTLFLLYALDCCIWNPNFAVGFTAQDLGSVKDLLRRNVKHAYKKLPPEIRAAVKMTTDNKFEIAFSNGSLIRAGVSMRSGVYQMLHVSEFGKICAKMPEKAKEIVTGSFQTVGMGNIKVVESTAEGYEGYFHDYCQTARELALSGRKLSKLDWRFFFFPWWKNPEYELDPETAVVSDQLTEYFDKKEKELSMLYGKPIVIGPRKRAWYAVKIEEMGELMRREYPSDEDEAFASSIEGKYYAKNILLAHSQGRITKVPINPAKPINTAWDLGVDDFTSIWFHQRDGLRHNIVGYAEFQGTDIKDDYNYIKQKYLDQGYVLGNHYLPHDVRNRSKHDKRKLSDIAETIGLRPVIIVDTPELSISLLQDVKDFLGTCWFDEEACKLGLSRLKNYSMTWSEQLSAYIDTPRHDDNSHGADAMRMLCKGYEMAPAEVVRSGRKKKYVSGMAA